MHLGGAYVARTCYRIARARGIEFALIADDVAYAAKVGPLTNAQRADACRYAEAFEEDLAWLGYTPDIAVMASTLRDAHDAAAHELGIPQPGGGELPGLLRYVHHLAESGATCSYSPWLVLGRVTDDHEIGVIGYARGADLVTEAQLYDHFGRTLYGEGYHVLQEYMPVLLSPQTLGVCSKSAGGDTIRELREAGITATDINAALDSVVVHSDSGYGTAHMRYVRLSPEWETMFSNTIERSVAA